MLGEEVVHLDYAFSCIPTIEPFDSHLLDHFLLPLRVGRLRLLGGFEFGLQGCYPIIVLPDYISLLS